MGSIFDRLKDLMLFIQKARLFNRETHDKSSVRFFSFSILSYAGENLATGSTLKGDKKCDFRNVHPLHDKNTSHYFLT
jgi:hypothetical protein